MTTVSAAGKLMLLGEHAVVYGYPCIVTAVDRYLTVSLEKTGKKKDVIFTPDVSDDRFVRQAIAVFRKKFLIKDKIYLETKSNLGNYGLGSSAAVTVATLKALMKLFRKDLSFKDRLKTPRRWPNGFIPRIYPKGLLRGGVISNEEHLFNLSYKVIQKVQGLGSGFDLAACIWGGTIYFDGKSRQVEKLTDEKLPLVVGFSGRKAKTVKMVEKIKKMRENNPGLVEDVFKSIAGLVEKGKKAVMSYDWVSLGKLMTENHFLLRKLGATTEKLDRLVSAGFKAGAYGAKLSGAGGGDCMIALVSLEKKKQVEQAIEDNSGELVGIKS